MQDYELVLIFNPEEIKKETEAVKLAKKLIKPADIKLGKVDNWGSRQMAYPIKNHASGWYLLMEVQVPSEKLVTLHKTIRAEDRVLRHFLVRTSK